MAIWISPREGAKNDTAFPKAMAFPDAIREREEQLIRGRRPEDAAGRPAVGLAISGGGIRSATFALGVLQALQSIGILSRFDYLSTVSGGGYIGTFLGSLFIDAAARKEDAAPAAGAAAAGESAGNKWESVDKALRTGSVELQWLRENGRYLSPNGTQDSWLAGAVILRNWATVQIVMSVFFFALFTTAALIRAVAPECLACVFPQDADACIWWSPWFLLPLAAVALWAIPVGWAYWFVPAGRLRDWVLSIVVAALVVVAALSGLAWLARPERFGDFRGAARSDTGRALIVIGFIAFEALIVRLGFKSLRTLDAQEKARNVLSGVLKAALLVSVFFASFALIDSLGQTLYVQALHGNLGKWFGAVVSAVAAVAAFGDKLGTLLAKGAKRKRVALPAALVALVAALLLAVVMLTGISAAGYAVAWSLQDPARNGAMSIASLSIAAIIAWVGSVLLGNAFTFINQSSQASFYAARLTRAYLGASNPERLEPGRAQSVTQVIPGDDIPLRSYRPEVAKGPLHILNVTLNETMDGRSQVEQRDRKGMNMAVGPAAISVGVRHHAEWVDRPRSVLRTVAPPSTREAPQFRVFEPRLETDQIAVEALPLGRWVAISGAAVSTGLGWRTSLGLSLLCGLFNVRLGHWWWTDTEPKKRAGEHGRLGLLRSFGRSFSRVLPVHSHLLDEWLARFPGTSRRHWYLTDGGHFENTACYELLRRRVPMIVLLDNGEDAAYHFEDVSHLVRKARLDFGAEIRFMSDEELAAAAVDAEVRKAVGPLTSISGWRRKGSGLQGSPRCAALATVTYTGDDKPGSLLLVIKPTVMDDDPQDIIEYALANESFPQQSTANQYFDEAQWESYRKLGERIGRRVFAAPPSKGAWWHPASLDPRPLL